MPSNYTILNFRDKYAHSQVICLSDVRKSIQGDIFEAKQAPWNLAC